MEKKMKTGKEMSKNNYRNFISITLISLVIMYAAMFSSVNEIGHIYNSLTMLYMTLIMLCPMSLAMLLFMRGMYADKKLNAIIIIILLAVFILSLIFLRNQTFVNDEDYLKHMITHHSSAILTSENVNLQDPEIKALAKSIIETQEREITQMRDILERLG